jgi:tetratricopeptide (TPR) repeat protein
MSTKSLLSGVLVAAFLVFLSGCNLDPEAAKARFVDRGNEYFNQRKYKEASIMYRNALKKDLKYGEAYYRIGLVHKKQGFQDTVRAQDIMQAVNAFRRALEDERLSRESRVAAMSDLAEIYVWYFTTNPTGQDREFLTKEVAKLRDDFFKLDPESFEGMRLDGFIQLTEGNLDESIETMTKALSKRPDDSGLKLAIMGIKIRQNKKSEAEQIAREIIAKDPKYGAAYDALYLLYMMDQRRDEAARVLEDRNVAIPGSVANAIRLAQHYRLFGDKDRRLSLLNSVANDTDTYKDGREMVIRHHFQFAEWDEAIRYAQEGLEKDPAKKAAYNNYIAEAMLKKGDRNAAKDLVEQTLAQNENNAVALALKSQINLDSRDPGVAKEAIADLTKAITSQPNNVVMRYDLGRAYVAAGEIEKGLNEFRQAVQRRPNYAPAHLAIAKMSLYRREYGNAITSADRVLQLTQRRPNPDAILVKAMAQVGTGETEKARELLIRAINIYPRVLEFHFELGRIYLSKNQVPQAEQYFKKVLEISPKDFRGMAGMAEVYARTGKLDYAIDFLKGKLTEVENPVLLRNAIGNLLVRKGDLDGAIENYQELAKVAPQSADLNLRMGEVYRRKGDLQSAITYLQRASDLDQNNLVPVMQTAMVLHQMGRNREATDAYERAVRLDPENVVALNNLAYMHAETGGDLDLALRYAETAKRKEPRNPEIDDTLGWIYVKKKLNDNALVILRNLVKQHPTNSTYRYHLGVALAQSGDTEQAREELNRALRSNPSEKDAEEIRKMLAKL